ncbi:hypothetical protein K0M31_006465 [Melipona bicolor]|uniref:Uncharacterized protein n=1 Tax=Melipona bicolor TaxID=60889 RepID=A0AA40KLY1_9HYME|nr:hypothetical protein K0M31_006465 [Melipona bicolor]
MSQLADNKARSTWQESRQRKQQSEKQPVKPAITEKSNVVFLFRSIFFRFLPFFFLISRFPPADDEWRIDAAKEQPNERSRPASQPHPDAIKPVAALLVVRLHRRIHVGVWL